LPEEVTMGEELKSLAEVDKTIHEPARLMILAHLYAVESADFLFLRRQTGLTAGNLSSHLSKLESAGYVGINKEFLGRKPHTILRLTERGRQAFDEYRDRLRNIVEMLPSQ
jgi:DNA-binding transcriptional ArsR family regulator